MCRMVEMTGARQRAATPPLVKSIEVISYGTSHNISNAPCGEDVLIKMGRAIHPLLMFFKITRMVL